MGSQDYFIDCFLPEPFNLKFIVLGRMGGEITVTTITERAGVERVEAGVFFASALKMATV